MEKYSVRSSATKSSEHLVTSFFVHWFKSLSVKEKNSMLMK